MPSYLWQQRFYHKFFLNEVFVENVMKPFLRALYLVSQSFTIFKSLYFIPITCTFHYTIGNGDMLLHIGKTRSLLEVCDSAANKLPPLPSTQFALRLTSLLDKQYEVTTSRKSLVYLEAILSRRISPLQRVGCFEK